MHVLFLVPDGFEEDWAQTDLWREAGEIPGAQRTIDRLGAESQRFGASSSGATYLYDSAGRLVFRGGITGSRGHEGDNAGESAVLAFVAGRAKQAFVETPVFGCDLLDHSSPHACRLEAPCPL